MDDFKLDKPTPYYLQFYNQLKKMIFNGKHSWRKALASAGAGSAYPSLCIYSPAERYAYRHCS